MWTTRANLGNRRFTRFVVVAALSAGAGVAAAQEPVERRPIVVRLADGSSVPLRRWTLSYEYFTWREGGSQAQGTASRRSGADLWVGKKTYPLVGATLEIEYELVERERDVDGEAKKVKVPTARKLKLDAAGKTTELKADSPSRDLLAPGLDKKLALTARSLDLRGESLTGTKMDFCVLSYSVLDECGESPEHQVTQIHL